jgi:hypothetical protein
MEITKPDPWKAPPILPGGRNLEITVPLTVRND